MEGENNETLVTGLPLGLMKQAVMKIESAMTDIYEIKEDDGLSDENKYAMNGIAEILGQVNAVIVNIVSEEMGEEEFLSEIVDMDPIDPYPGDDVDIMDQQVE